ncbi:hypothetical protein I350_08357 [Cryptococcus amylolentus CBS 6273]|uniref:Uncharacterized protein n=1 Tax=Cryptococcus amylolentus CBS 6273 TaxID=1296118 RepID=A0A1E3J8T3_9TREE|nr:hypothetical protein I350_08357 [Cryptococcus amylolentus CBS 6273]
MATYAPHERAYYDALFAFLDKEGTSVLPGQDIYPFLTSSALPTNTLGEIWALSDPDNNGFLTKDGWYRAARLIGWLQNGAAKSVDEDLLSKAGPLPTFPTGPKPSAQPPLQAQTTGQPLSANVTGQGFPPISPADRAKFTRLFAGAGPANGLLSGDKARDMFVKSGLSYEKLGKIWQVFAVLYNRGSLDLTDWIIGMHLIQSAMADPNLNLPLTLPPGAYEAASGGRSAPPVAPVSPLRGNTASPVRPQYTGGIAPLQQQGTGGSARAPQRQMTGSTFSPARQASGASQPWDVTPQAKATSDQFFSQLDTQNKGVIEGDVAVPFMIQSQLDEGTLASIWDLADIRKEGKLTRDEFAVAMHLINAKLAGQEVPATLPLSLIPPSLRENFGPGKQEVLAQPSSATRDLFDLFADDPPPPTTAAPAAAPAAPAAKSLSPAPTGQSKPPALPARTPSQSSAQPFSTSFLGQPPAPPARRQTSQSSTKTLSPAATGQSSTPAPSSFATTFASSPPKRGGDLMGDEGGDTSSTPVPDHSAEYGNKQNQLQQTTRGLTDLSNQRAELEGHDQSSKSQLQELEQKLAGAREKHQQELRAVADLRIRVGEQQAKVKQLNTDLITFSSDVSALQSEKTELEQALLHDKEEVRGLQRQMKEVEEEKAGLGMVLERLRKEARQQKGMVTIAKKQLQTAEEKRDGVQKEIRGVEDEIESDKAVIEQHNASQTTARSAPEGAFSPDRLATASAVPVPGTPQALSPTATGRSNNPFDRFIKSSASASPSADEQGLGNAALFGVGAAATAAAGVVAAGVGGAYETAKSALTDEPEQNSQTGTSSVPTPAPEASGEPAPQARDAEDAADKAKANEEAEQDPFGVPTSGPITAIPAHEDVDPFGAPATPSQGQGGFGTDPFGAPTVTGADAPNGFGADDGFGDSFGAAPAQEARAAATEQSKAPADFDSAFADFESPAEATEEQATLKEEPSSPPQGGIPAGLPKSHIPQLDDRPEPERSLSTQAVASDSEPSTPYTPGSSVPGAYHAGSQDSFNNSEVSTPGLAGVGTAAGAAGLGAAGVGSALTREVQPDEPETPRAEVSEPYVDAREAADSSDEEEEPEDIEGPRREYGKAKEEAFASEEPGAAQPEVTSVQPVSEPRSGAALAPALAPSLDPFGASASEEQEQKIRRSAPPPPTKAVSPAPVVASAGGPDVGEQFDPFGAPTAVSSSAAFGNVATAQVQPPVPARPEQQQPQTASFDEDEFDFSDLPPAQVDQTSSTAGFAPSSAAGQGQTTTQGGGFDDEFASFDDEFNDESGAGGNGNASDLSSGNKSYEMVSPNQPSAAFAGQSQPSAAQQAPAAGGSSGLYDEWGFGSKKGPATESPVAATQGLSQFDDAFGGDFEPAQSTEQYAPPSGPPPPQKDETALRPPAMPERRPSGAQADDIEDVKKLCAMGFPRDLVIAGLEANGFDFQKTLNVLLS